MVKYGDDQEDDGGSDKASERDEKSCQRDSSESSDDSDEIGPAHVAETQVQADEEDVETEMGKKKKRMKQMTMPKRIKRSQRKTSQRMMRPWPQMMTTQRTNSHGTWHLGVGRRTRCRWNPGEIHLHSRFAH